MKNERFRIAVHFTICNNQKKKLTFAICWLDSHIDKSNFTATALTSQISFSGAPHNDNYFTVIIKEIYNVYTEIMKYLLTVYLLTRLW